MSDPPQPSSRAPESPMDQPTPLDPVQVVAQIPDTSPQALGLEDEGDKCLGSGLRRVVEKTVDKLGRGRSVSNKSPSKRIFSLGRGRGKDPSSLGTIPICPYRDQLVLISRRL
jgi:hypothetical protein